MTAGTRAGRPNPATDARRGPGFLDLAVITRGDVATVRKDLGRRSAEWRGTAKLTQGADREVSAAGGLPAALDSVDVLVRALQAQAMRARERQRAEMYAPPAQPVASDGCGVAVGRSVGGPGGSRGRCGRRCG